MSSKVKLVAKFIALLALSLLSRSMFSQPCFALDEQLALTGQRLTMFAENNILFYDPTEYCGSKLTLDGDCFKVSSSTSASAFWYGEGCLNTGDCESGKYRASGKPAGQDNGLLMTKQNKWIYNDTKVDESFGGLQYIYAENYDYDYDKWPTKMTPNGGSSTRKYYWIVLPDKAYANSEGELYVATFEKLSEPVYFVTFDVHACEHQSYCDAAEADPDKVEIGEGFFGVLSKKGGNASGAISAAGKLTSFCRLQGKGEVKASSSHSGTTTTGGGSSKSKKSKSKKSDETKKSEGTTYAGEYPQYLQGNYEGSDHVNSSVDWTSLPYSSGTVKNSGCGPVSMAMLATVATGMDIYPQDIIDITKSTGYYPSTGLVTLDPIVGKKYGFKVITETYSSKTDAYKKIKKYLNDGYMIHFSGEGCHEGFAVPYARGGCTKGHYAGIFSIDENDRVKVANSAFGGNSETDLQNLIDAIHNGVFTAIEGGGGNRNSCGGDNNSLKNLTEEEAKKIADYYNSSKVSATEWSLPHGKKNCVSFSRWFAQALTSMGKVSLSGNGRDTAHNIAVAGGFTEGNEEKTYSVFAVTKGRVMCGSSLCGHTGIIVSVDKKKDDIITIEAGYPSTPAQVRHRNSAYFVNSAYDNKFTYLDSAIDNDKINEILGS